MSETKECIAEEGKGNEKDKAVNFEALVAQKQAIIDDYVNDLKRIQAEFENYKKRVEREQKEYKTIIEAKVLVELLPIVDSLEAGIQALERHKNKDTEMALQGLKTLDKQLKKFLHAHNVKEISSTGKPLNLELHEVIAKECVHEKPDEIVLEEIQKGYYLGDKVLRHAKVKINKIEN